MGLGFGIPYIRGQNTFGRIFDIPFVEVKITMGTGLKIPLIGG
jgi:hypothetical protein